jgi:hypothetical protein
MRIIASINKKNHKKVVKIKIKKNKISLLQKKKVAK